MNYIILSAFQSLAATSLLDNSQTFIGVLATLIVLYLYSGENNFFIAFIKHLKEEVRENIAQNITALSNDIDSKFWSPEEQNEDEFLRKAMDPIIATETSDRKETVKKYQQKLFSIVVEAKKIPFEFMNKYNPLAVEAGERMDKLAKALEFEFVALYTFFFSVLILFLDCTTTLGDFGCHFLYSFTISSSVLILFMWLHLWRRLSEKYIKKSDNAYRYRKVELKSHIFFYLKLLLLFVCVPTIAMCLGGYLDSYYLDFVFVVFVYCICFYFGGRERFNLIKNTHKYNRHFVLSHFIYLLIASIMIALLCTKVPLKDWIISLNNWVIVDSGRIMENHCNELDLFKDILVTFLVFNGVVIPFMLTYAKSKVIRLKLGSVLDEGSNNASAKIEELKIEYTTAVKEFKDFVTKN